MLAIFDATKDSGKDPVRTHRGRLSGTSDFTNLPTLGPATSVPADDRSAKAPTAGVIHGTAVMETAWENVSDKIDDDRAKAGR
jgi:hypothetical protein